MHDETTALHCLTAVLGPLPEEWVESLGTEAHPSMFAFLFSLGFQEHRIPPALLIFRSNRGSNHTRISATHASCLHYFSRSSYLTHFGDQRCQSFYTIRGSQVHQVQLPRPDLHRSEAGAIHFGPMASWNTLFAPPPAVHHLEGQGPCI